MKLMHHLDSNFRINNMNSKKPTCFDIIDAIVSLWYNDDKIQKNNIIRSCKIIGISINLDGTENYLVKKNSELCEEIIGPDDVINDNDDDIYSEDSSISSDSKSKKNNLEQPKITNYFNKLDDNHMDIEK